MVSASNICVAAGGELVLDNGTIENAGELAVKAGGTLSGDGVVQGNCSVAGTISPGDGAQTGHLDFDGDLTFSGSATFACNLNGNSVVDLLTADGVVSGVCNVHITKISEVIPWETVIVDGAGGSSYASFSKTGCATCARVVLSGGRLALSDTQGDTDSDNMPDRWEELHFASIESAAPGDDIDVDGLSNVLEYLRGQNPLNRSAPSWWMERSVLVSPSPVVNDHAAVNQGQFKWILANAYDEVEAELSGGASAELSALIASLSVNNNNYQAVNLGQLKAAAMIFYDRLASASPPLADGYPWTNTSSDDNDYATANIGQIKHVFSFKSQ